MAGKGDVPPEVYFRVILIFHFIYFINATLFIWLKGENWKYNSLQRESSNESNSLKRNNYYGNINV